LIILQLRLQNSIWLIDNRHLIALIYRLIVVFAWLLLLLPLGRVIPVIRIRLCLLLIITILCIFGFLNSCRRGIVPSKREWTGSPRRIVNPSAEFIRIDEVVSIGIRHLIKWLYDL
jgi:hypothetical protein